MVVEDRERDRVAAVVHDGADELGQQHLVVLARVVRGGHRAGEARPTSAGSNPHRFIETSESGVEHRRLEAVVRRERAVDARVTSRRSVIAGEHAVGHLAHAPGDRQVADEGAVEAEPDEAVGASRDLDVPAEHREGVGAVEVVGVGDAERGADGRASPRAASTASTVPIGRSWTQNATSTRRGHARRHVRSMRRPVSGFTTSTSLENPARSASPASRSMTASPFGADRARGA